MEINTQFLDLEANLINQDGIGSEHFARGWMGLGLQDKLLQEMD